MEEREESRSWFDKWIGRDFEFIIHVDGEEYKFVEEGKLFDGWIKECFRLNNDIRRN